MPDKPKERHPVRRIVMLFKSKWQFINYRKEFKCGFPIKGWIPEFDRYWMGDIWQITWRGYAISVDMRTNWMADMIHPVCSHVN